MHYNNKFLLCYDAFLFPLSRIRFTIAHEIGHIVLGHFDYDESVINSSKFKHYFDFEANCFAAELLMPKFMLEDYNTCCKEEVTKEFHVSNKAIETRIKILNSSSFLNNFYIDFCRDCGSLIYARRPFYCQSCGGKINNIRVLSNF